MDLLQDQQKSLYSASVPLTETIQFHRSQYLERYLLWLERTETIPASKSKITWHADFVSVCKMRREMCSKKWSHRVGLYIKL